MAISGTKDTQQTYLGAGDGAELRELLAEHLVVDGVVKILDVQVHALVAVDALHLETLKLLLQLRVTFRLLLRTSHVDDVSVHLLVVPLLHGLTDQHIIVM